jgi:hypothetical protein
MHQWLQHVWQLCSSHVTVESQLQEQHVVHLKAWQWTICCCTALAWGSCQSFGFEANDGAVAAVPAAVTLFLVLQVSGPVRAL